MKICTRCHKNKNIKYFGKNIHGTKGYNSQCKKCRNKIRKFYYKFTKKIREQQRLIHRKNKKRNRKFIYDYLINHPCIDCGDDRLDVLDFDHVRGKKHKNISFMVRSCYSIERIKEEIKKCEVRCSNCHRLKSIKQFGWFTYSEWK